MVTFGNSRCAIPSWLQVSLFRTARSSQGRAVGAAERTLDGEDWSERIKQPGNWTRVGVLDWVKSREHAPVFFGKRRHQENELANRPSLRGRLRLEFPVQGDRDVDRCPNGLLFHESIISCVPGLPKLQFWTVSLATNRSHPQLTSHHDVLTV